MRVLAPALALAVVAAVSPPARPIAGLSLAALRAPDLAVRMAPEAQALALPVEDAPRPRGAMSAPVCSGDVCQPVVAVPGYEPSYGRPRGGEAFAALLARAHLEPFASVAWAVVATGLRFEYRPVALDGQDSASRGWGSAFLRIRFRLDASNRPVIPPRPR